MGARTLSLTSISLDVRYFNYSRDKSNTMGKDSITQTYSSPPPSIPPPIPTSSPLTKKTVLSSPKSKHGKSQGVTKSAKTKKNRKPPPPREPPPIIMDKPDIALETALFGDSLSDLPSISDKPPKPYRN